jgi:hypothetical protein
MFRPYYQSARLYFPTVALWGRRKGKINISDAIRGTVVATIGFAEGMFCMTCIEAPGRYARSVCGCGHAATLDETLWNAV